MPNRVYLSKSGFIYNQHVGDQTGETVTRMTEKLAVLTKQLKDEKRPVFALIDLTKLGKQDTTARRAAAEGLRTLKYDRAAIYSSDPILRYVVSLVIRASGQTSKVKFFGSRKEAMAFLKMGTTQHG